MKQNSCCLEPVPRGWTWKHWPAISMRALSLSYGNCAASDVGPAEYVLLRGPERLHIFPGDDVGARKNLQRWLHLADSLDYDSVAQTLARWRDYGGLIYFHLLLDRLAEVCHLEGGLRCSI